MTKDEDIEKVAEESTEVGDETEDDKEMFNGVEECTDQHGFKPLTVIAVMKIKRTMMIMKISAMMKTMLMKTEKKMKKIMIKKIRMSKIVS